MSRPRLKSRKRAPALERALDSTAKIDEYFSNLRDETVILFADLAGSTLYKQEHGFFAGLARTRYHNTVVADVVSKYRGIVVKYLGDGVLCRWNVGSKKSNAYRAVNAAIHIQETFSKHNSGLRGLEAVESRIGIAMGVVADFYGEDPQGSTVDLAARIQAIAKPGQILAHKRVTTMADWSRVSSRLGAAKGYDQSDYFGAETPVHLKGFPEAQQITEIRWKEHLDGIDQSYASDIWEDYHYNAKLFPLDESEESDLRSLAESHFGICFDLKYKTVLRRSQFPFVCVDSMEDFGAAMRDRSLFVRYRLPHLRNDIPKDKLFDVSFARINDIALHESLAQLESKRFYFARMFTASNLEQLNNQKVTLHYQLRTVISKRGGFFFMTTESTVRGLTMTFDMGSVPIRHIQAIGYFGTPKPPTFVHTPNRENPTKIELHLDDLIPAGSGAVFVWNLRDET